MAPKKKVVGAVVKTRRKVVEESVEVSVMEEGGGAVTRTTSVPMDREKVTTTEINIETQPLEAETEDVFQGSLDDAGKGKAKSRALVDSQESGKGTTKGEGVKKEPATAPKKPVPGAKKRVPVVGLDEETQEEDQEFEEEADEEGRPQEQKKTKQQQQRRRRKKQPQLPTGEEAKAKTGGKKEPSASGRKRGRGRRSSGAMDRKKDAVAGGRLEGGSTYKRYVFKVLKQVHPEMGVSSMAMRVLDGYMRDMFERLVDEAATLSKVSGRATLTSREIQGAVRLVLPGELARHAISEGVKAVAKFME